jgi:hypothetical protein
MKKKKTKKPRGLPRGKMPPPTEVHKDRKKEQNKKWCRQKEIPNE